MSTSKSTNTTPTDQVSISRCELLFLRHAAAIVKQFNDKQMPFNPGIIKTTIIHALCDHGTNTRNSVLTADDISNLFLLCNILDEIDKLNSLAPPKRVCLKYDK